MYILGISCFYRDSAASLLRNGEIVAAVQEERFSRKKFDASFPLESIRYCLKEANIAIKDIDYVAFYDNDPPRISSLTRLFKKLNYQNKIISFSQEESYLASAFYPSPFKEAAILVNDGDRTGIVLGKGTDKTIEVIKNSGLNYSLSAIYSAVTHYLGFNNIGDEYKVMGLAAYGKPRYKNIILKCKKELSSANTKKTLRILSSLFDVIPRRVNDEITHRHMDIAASVQAAVEEEVLKICKRLFRITGLQNLCLSGSLSLNCVANTKILQQGLFKDIWIQPASADAGCAVGAAFLFWHKYLNKKRPALKDAMKDGFLGPAYSDTDIESFLKKYNIPYKKLNYSKIAKACADLIAKGNVVGWFQGRMEFGPRSLGARSILADSRNIAMPERINQEIKFREPFRPLAPVVLAEKKEKYFNLKKENPYMLLVAQVKKDKRNSIPAVTHVDNSSRIQTIKRDGHPLYYDTIYEFYQKTGCPVIVNTSFNTKDEPIVLSPEDAYHCFKKTDMDYLMMGSFLLDKQKNKT